MMLVWSLIATMVFASCGKGSNARKTENIPAALATDGEQSLPCCGRFQSGI